MRTRTCIRRGRTAGGRRGKPCAVCFPTGTTTRPYPEECILVSPREVARAPVPQGPADRHSGGLPEVLTCSHHQPIGDSTMQATGTQGMCTRACVSTERVEAGPGRSTPWNGRRRALGAPLSGLRMGHGGLCRTGAGSRSRRRVAMPRLPIAGGLAGTTRPTAASDGMAGGRPGWESPNPHLCAKMGGGDSWSAGPPVAVPGAGAAGRVRRRS